MEKDNPFRDRSRTSTFLRPGTLYLFFYLVIDLHLTPAEKLAGRWKLDGRTDLVNRMVYDWCLSGLGGMTGAGARRLRYLIELIGDDLKDEGVY